MFNPYLVKNDTSTNILGRVSKLLLEKQKFCVAILRSNFAQQFCVEILRSKELMDFFERSSVKVSFLRKKIVRFFLVLRMQFSSLSKKSRLFRNAKITAIFLAFEKKEITRNHNQRFSLKKKRFLISKTAFKG